MTRQVRGSFFAEYVRMLRREKGVAWTRVLPAEDHVFLTARIEDDRWYPMTSFERLGIAILRDIPGATPESARLWGRLSAGEYAHNNPGLIVEGEPVDTLMRLKVMRATLFDFPAFDLPLLSGEEARVVVNYHMSPIAEEAACHQTVGFCEGVLSLAGASNIVATFEECAWKGAPTTLALLTWSMD